MQRPYGIWPAVMVGMLAASVSAAGPDVIVSNLFGDASNQLASAGYEDPNGDGNLVSAFAVGTTSCNIGNQNLDWVPETDQHPAIHQGMYRLKDGRFEQVGMSWIKHGFFALNENFCAVAGQTCIPPNPNTGRFLKPGCSDPYTAGLNANRSFLGPTWEINAHTGGFDTPHLRAPQGGGTGGIGNRLQVHNDDLNPDLNAGALYFVQGHYVHPDDAFAGNGNNNASYRRIVVIRSVADPNRYDAYAQGITEKMQCAIRAWKDNDPFVMEVDAQVPAEGLFILSAKVTDLGTGFFHYEYALQNLNSDRSGGSFTVPLPEGVYIENIGFHDVDYHSGDGSECPGCVCSGGSNHAQACNRNGNCPGGTCFGQHLNYDGTDWEATVEVGSITWQTTSFDENPAANALRWSSLYNFRFDANIEPDPDGSTVTLGLFKPGFPSEIAIRTTGPKQGLIDCNNNTVPDACDLDCEGLGCEPPCGGSFDCNGNHVPDECEADCNDNDIPDACDVAPGECDDCDHDGLPDPVSEDCQPNTVPDECETDCDGDTIPDTCEVITDIDGDGVEDCDDLCPETTPVGACLPPYQELVNCCFSNGIMDNFYTWSQCLNLCANDPNPEDCGPVCDDPPTCPGTRCRETSCRDGCLMGDFDRDGDLDLFDTGALQVCFSSSIGTSAFVSPSSECLLRFDFDDDGDVDLADAEEFFAAYSGP